MFSISVVIPTFDRAEVLPRALDSALTQTRPPDEIIVVDDGSTDATSELMAERYPQIELIRQQNRGVAAARNRGIEAARGEWIALLDSDDAWLSEKLECQRAALEAHPGHRLCHTEEIWIRRGRRVNPMKKHRKAGGWIFRRCLPLCVVSPSAALIHRSVFGEVGLFDESLPACEDYDFWLRVCSRMPALFVEQPLIVKYGGHADQLSRRYWGMDRFRIRALEKIVREEALSPEDRRAALETLIRKIDVYLAGAKKRGKTGEAKAYEGRKTRHLQALRQMGETARAASEF